MGEYARRLRDGERVKIGTCENMYYLRFEERHQVLHEEGNVDVNKNPEGLRFRLPFPDEDHVALGEYDDYDRSLPLFHRETRKSFECGELPPGTIQLTHRCGYLLNAPCYHGAKLPEAGVIQAHWNGKAGYFLALQQLKCLAVSSADGQGGFQTRYVVKPVIGCEFCHDKWLCDWSDVWDYISDEWRERLEVYRDVEEAMKK